MNFFTELKRRNVLRAAALYAAGAWLLVQVATQVFPLFHVAEWVMRWIVVASVIGFPFAVIFSWFYEWTSHGLKLESEMLPNEAITWQSGRKLDRWIIAFLSMAVILLLANQFVLHRDETKSADTESRAMPIAGKSIAVLPFENLSGDKDNAYFASGMQDMILTKLAGIGDLKVISRTSTEKYTSHPDDLKVVGQQLGVSTILEGSVQKSGNEVLINLQLIDAASDNHLWADAYPRTLENIFGVEGEVAQKVADALKAKLTSAESASIVLPPTRNAAAYDTFLKAEGIWPTRPITDSSTRTTRPPSMSIAAHRARSGLCPGLCKKRLHPIEPALVRQPAVSAGELCTGQGFDRPRVGAGTGSIQAHIALGYYYYWGFRQYDLATAQFQTAQKSAPSNAKAAAGLAYVARRTGQMLQALRSGLRADLVPARCLVAHQLW